jgi:hypothetical protein
VFVNGNVFGTGFSGSRDVAMDTTNGLEPVVESGVLVGGGGLISIPFVNAPVGTPLTISLHAQAHAIANVSGDGNGGWSRVTAAGYTTFYDTLSFDTSGPAFVLPEGYRVDSPTARVENSMFIPESPTLPGDIDQDGDVDRTDAATFSQFFGLDIGSIWVTGDFNGDHATTLADFAILQAHLNLAPATSPPASHQSVPEPSSLALLVCGVLAAFFVKRPLGCVRYQRQSPVPQG